jgi:GTP-binding protein EngB required for normal cell division
MSWEEDLRTRLTKAGGFDEALDVVKEAKFRHAFDQMIQKFEDPTMQTTHLDRMNVFSQAVQFLDLAVEGLEIDGKDIIFFCGPSRVGKGTLLEALGGTKMMLQETSDEGLDLGDQRIVMRPEYDSDALSIKESGPAATIGHGANSHTFHPKVIFDFSVNDPPILALKGYVLVDMPGLFDTKGEEFAMAIQNSMYKMVKRANSSRCLVLLSAGMFQDDNQRMITLIKQTLKQIFHEPEEYLTVGITKLHRDCHQFRYNETGILDRIKGNKPGYHISLSEYRHVLPVKPDDQDNISKLALAIAASPDLKTHVNKGCIDIQAFVALIAPNNEEEKEAEITTLTQELRSQMPFRDPQQALGNDPSQKLTEEGYLKFIDHQIQVVKELRQYWEKAASFSVSPSLKGLVPTHRVFDELLKQGNPVIKAVIYQDESNLAQTLYKDLLVSLAVAIGAFKQKEIEQGSISAPKKRAILKSLVTEQAKLKQVVSHRLGWTEQEFYDFAARRQRAANSVGASLGVAGASFGIAAASVAISIGVPTSVVAEGLLALSFAGPLGWIVAGSAVVGVVGYGAWEYYLSECESEEEAEMAKKMKILFEHSWAQVRAFEYRIMQCKNQADIVLEAMKPAARVMDQ